MLLKENIDIELGYIFSDYERYYYEGQLLGFTNQKLKQNFKKYLSHTKLFSDKDILNTLSYMIDNNLLIPLITKNRKLFPESTFKDNIEKYIAGFCLVNSEFKKRAIFILLDRMETTERLELTLIHEFGHYLFNYHYNTCIRKYYPIIEKYYTYWFDSFLELINKKLKLNLKDKELKLNKKDVINFIKMLVQHEKNAQDMYTTPKGLLRVIDDFPLNGELKRQIYISYLILIEHLLAGKSLQYELTNEIIEMIQIMLESLYEAYSKLLNVSTKKIENLTFCVQELVISSEVISIYNEIKPQITLSLLKQIGNKI